MTKDFRHIGRTSATSPLPPETTTYLGIALVATGIADFAIIAMQKRTWMQPR